MPRILGFTLDHAETKVLIVDREYSKVMKDALARAKVKPLVIDYDDPEFTRRRRTDRHRRIRRLAARGR